MSPSDEQGPGDTQPLKSGSRSSARHRTLKLLAGPGTDALRSLADAAAINANPGVTAEVYGMTDVGRVRSVNQDQFLVAALERSLLVEGSSFPAQAGTRLTDTPQGRLLIVADGIGGHGGGEVASAVAIDAMAHYAFETMPWMFAGDECSGEELTKGLREAMRKAQDRVRRVARRKALNEDMGTTLTMAYVAWPDCYFVHAGDSRAYLLRDDELHRLTRDHTLAQQLIDGAAMTEEEAASSRLSHVLVNAVGGRSDDLDVEMRHLALRLDDQLLLCTDGLSGMISDRIISEKLARTDLPVQEVVRQLIAAANDAGGRDNVTAVLVRF